MRILLVVHGFPPHAHGGAEIYAEQHARTLVRLFGDDVHVLTREQAIDRPEYAVRTERRDGLTITWVNNTFGAVRTFEDSYRNPRIAGIAANLIDRFRPEAAHVHHLTCLSTDIPHLLASRDVPVLFTLHDYWLLCHRGQLLDTHFKVCDGPAPSGCRSCLGIAAAPLPSALVPAVRAAERRMPRAIAWRARALTARLLRATTAQHEEPPEYRRLRHMKDVCNQVSGFLAPSHDIRDRFVRFGIMPERIELSPYGFDRGSPGPRVHARHRAPLRIGFLGALMVSKAPHLLLEAFRRLPAGLATVDLVGARADYHSDVSYRAILEPLLTLPGVHVRGPISHENVPDALSSLDVLVVPSIWPETSPLVIAEALLAGLPVVASRIGGIPELVKHGLNGLLFDPGDIEGLRRALGQLAQEPELLDRLREGARATPVRSIDDDVTAVRRLYELHASRRGRQAAAPKKRLAAIVLNFRTPADTAIAVGSLLASDRPPDRIIVVDHDSGAECRSRLARWGDHVAYVRTGSNLGFSGGMNIGIRHALDTGADLVLLVNSDMVVPPDCVAALETALAAGPSVGVVGPLILSRSRPDVVMSSGIDYNLRTSRMRHRGTGAAFDAVVGWDDADVAAVSGCFMMVAREVFDRVGLLDERYFFSFEEIDFCLRARAAGVRTRLVGRAQAYHEGGQAIGATSPRRLYFAARNHLMLAHTLANGEGRMVRGARVLFITALNVAHAARAPGSSLAARLGATASGVRDYLANRFGPGRID